MNYVNLLAAALFAMNIFMHPEELHFGNSYQTSMSFAYMAGLAVGCWAGISMLAWVCDMLARGVNKVLTMIRA